ncbi:MAG: gliding motility-associated C-terminal domain-containing protein, partial [Bacteroidales bacterium]
LDYQWYTNASGSWEAISGAESDEYIISEASNADVGDYRVEVSNTCGNNTSDTVSLTVRDTINIIEPPSDQHICEGETAQFGVDAEGYGSFSYTWQYNDGSSWEDLSTEGDITVDNDSLYIENTDTTDGGSYRVIIDGYCGTDTTAVATLDINWFEANIGEPSPFTIDTNTTLIEVHVAIRDHIYLYDLSHELTTPGENTLLLADTGNIYDAQYFEDANLTFSSDVSDVFDVNNDSPNGTYGILGDLSSLHGEDPSNGAWGFRVGDWDRWVNSDPKGYIDSVYISFTDKHSQTGDTTTVSYSQSLSTPINEYQSGVAYTEYVVSDELEIDCYGDSTATAVVSLFGGISPYSIEWSESPDFSSTIPELEDKDTVDLWAGTFYMRATDAMGCTAYDSVTVTEPPEIILDSLDVVNVDDLGGCYGDSIGEVHDSAYGGTGSLTYELIMDPYGDPDTVETNTTGDFTGLAAGEYLLEVFDENNCLKDTSFVITQPDSLQVVSESLTSLTDTGAADGTIDIYAEGGTDSLTYTLYDTVPAPDTIEAEIKVEPGDTANFTGLENGVYYAEVNDTNNCGPAISSYFDISAIEISLTADSVKCAGSETGSVYAEINGGILPYTYEWASLDTTTMNDSTLKVLTDTSMTTDTLDNLTAGAYLLNIKDSTGIASSDTILVHEPEPMVVDSITPDSSITCYGDSETFTAHVSGGIKPYTIHWQDENSMDTVATGDTVDLFAGSYYIKVSDSNGCEKIDSVTIIQPDSLRITDEEYTPLTSTGATDGTIDIDAAGGTPPLKYMLYEFTSTDTTGVDTTDDGEFTGLAEGDYYVKVTDSNGCDTIQSSDIPISALEIQFDINAVTCALDSNGRAIAEVIGGFEPFRYEWTNPAGDTLRIENTNEATDTLSNLSGGRYILNVIDSTGNNHRDTAEVFEPNPLVLEEIVPDTLSGAGESDGSIEITTTGGNDSIFFEVDNLSDSFGANRDTVEKANDTANTLFDGLPAGLYQITVYDENGCGFLKDTVNIDYYELNMDKTDIACNGETNGVAIAKIEGGTSPFTYDWADTTLTDSSSVDSLKNRPAGWYHVTVTDRYGFELGDSVEITEPDPLEIAIEDTLSVPCNGTSDKFGVDVNGGTSPYEINWFNESMDSIAKGDTANLNAGSYYIGVSDTNNCAVFDSVYIDEPEQIAIDSVNLIPQESEYTLEVWATGGNDSLFVTVETNDTTHNPDSGYHKNDTTAGVFESLSGGTYTITATDSLKCGPDDVTLTFPLTVNLSVVETIDCYGDSNGAVAVEVEGGKPNYSYDWSDGTLHTHKEQQDTIYNLDADTYSITVTDYFGLEASASIDLDQPDPIVANPKIQQANCASDHMPLAGEDVGYIKLNPSGGTQYSDEDFNYRYHWSEETDTLTGKDSLMHLSGGNYQVTILDRNGCETTTSFDVPQPDDNIIDIQIGGVTDSICHGDRVNIYAEDAQNADSLNWRNTSGGYETLQELDTLSENLTSPKTYVLEAKNAQCMYIDSVNVGLYPHLGIQINEQDEENDGNIKVKENMTAKSLNATVQNSDIQATYSWRPNEFFDPADQLETELQVERLRQEEVAEQLIWIEAETKNCVETDSAMVQIIPNVEPLDAFSPNDDNINDTWRIEYAEQYENIEVTIFNRWGVEVYHQKPYRNENGWKGRTSKGKRLPSGTYYYVIKTHESGIQPLSGTVTIMR